MNSHPPTLNSSRAISVELFVVALIFVVGFASRFLLGGIPNFKPIAALAIFGGFYFQRATLGLFVVISILMVSDFFIGGYDVTIAMAVYFSLGLGCWLGHRLASMESCCFVSQYARIVGSALLMGAVFFVLTNLAVWGAWYPPTLEGLVACYVNGLPFFKFTLAGNVFFSVGVFAVYDLVKVVACARRAAVAESV